MAVRPSRAASATAGVVTESGGGFQDRGEWGHGYLVEEQDSFGVGCVSGRERRIKVCGARWPLQRWPDVKLAGVMPS